MNILILGGTGAMGTHLCKILNCRGENVYVTTRRYIFCIDGLTYVTGDAHDTLFLRNVLSLREWDVIVDFMNYSTKEFCSRANILLGATKQYVFLSSSRVYANNEAPITEESPRLLDVCCDSDYLQTDEYALAKARQEDILRNSGKNNWTIIRPYVTFSENRIQLSPSEKEFWLYGALHHKTIVFSYDLANKYTTLTYGYDVARGIVSIMGNKDAFGEAFHITVSEKHKWSEILDHYLKVIEQKMGYRPNVKMLDKWNPMIGGGYDQVRWDRLYDRVFDNSKINNFIDTSSFKQTIPALTDCLEYFIDNPTFLNISWMREAKKDKLNGEWSRIEDIKGCKEKIKYLLIRTGLLS